MDESFLKVLNDFVNEYCQKIYPIPKIQEYKIIKNDKIAGYFNALDLYNQQYILNLNERFLKNDKQYLKSLFFHELTHLYDSGNLRKYELQKYLYIMQIYSEVHASEIEMDVLLDGIENVNVDSLINHYNIPIGTFMAIYLNKVNEEFILPDGPILKDQLKFDHKNLYYFIGYVLSLKKHNIECEFEYSRKIPSELLDLFNKITYYYLNNENIDYEILYSYQKEILNTTKKVLKEHREKYNLLSTN